MVDIFISYASEDRERAKQVAGALETFGWSVWWDRKIPVGETYDTVIATALKEAKCVVILWSRSAVASHWVREEAGDAQERRVLVPALLEDVEIPLGFRRLQAAHLQSWEGDRNALAFMDVVQAISKRLGLDTPPPPPPPPPTPTPTPPVAPPQTSPPVVSPYTPRPRSSPPPKSGRRWSLLVWAACLIPFAGLVGFGGAIAFGALGLGLPKDAVVSGCTVAAMVVYCVLAVVRLPKHPLWAFFVTAALMVLFLVSVGIFEYNRNGQTLRNDQGIGGKYR